MIRRIVLLTILFLMGGPILLFSDVSMTQTLQNYEQALQKLLIAHQEDPLYKNQDIFADPLILATYQKLISPSVAWINGYARVVFSEVARKYPYQQDLHTLSSEYAQHRANVSKIIKLLPKNVQAQALEIFHESLISIVGQVCFNIVSQLSSQNQANEKDLTAAYQAYLLAWQVKTSSMKLHGAETLQDFETIITQNMVNLFSNAISLAQNSLNSKMSSGVSAQEIYTNLEQYYKVLYQVYLNSGNTADATSQQNLLAALKIEQQNYTQAISQQTQATSLVQTSRKALILDIDNAATLLTSIDANIKNLSSAVTSYAQAQQLFESAQDTIDASVCAQLALEINDGDLLLRIIQKLWALYLNDQSTSAGFYTFPTLDQFVNGQASGQTSNAVQAIQNLVAMCSDQSDEQNNVGALISTTQNLQIMPILKNVLLFLEQNPNMNQKRDSLFDVKLLQAVQSALSILTDWCNQILQAANNSDQTAMASAMGYAKLLDTTWTQHKNMDQYVPNLPACLQSKKTWTNFTAQFLYQAGLVSSAQEAQALVGTVKVTGPVTVSAKSLQTMQNSADAYFAQAQAFEKSQNFAKATIAYEQALVLYQKLYQQESTGMVQIKMLELANQAKTRFAACSFGSSVQSQGSVGLGQILNIPTSYTAVNYQLTFAPTIMGSVMPACVNSLTAGQTLQKLSTKDEQDVFAWIKGYLVAQKMMDQGIIFQNDTPTFTNYFADYTLSKVVQTSQRAQVIVGQISSYLNNFENVGVSSVTLNSANQVSIALTNWPLEPLSPICSTLSTAGTYFSAAATLFAPGTTTLNFGGQTYDPGNDAASQSVMLENLGYTYLAQAQASNAGLKSLIQELSTLLGLTVKGATVQSLPHGFSQKFGAIQNQAISVQALLYGSDNAASGYFVQAGNTVMAKKIKDAFLSIYQQQIDFAKKCLIGDPTSFDYQTVVTAINQAYVSWASELDPVKDVGLVAHINEQIAKLYEFAGQKCLNFSYQIASFPDVSQKHFMVAAQYYRSAQLQYTSLQDTVEEKLLAAKLNDMYFQACIQNLNLYLHVKAQGALYDSASQNKEIPISFVQLLQDFNNGSIGAGESTLYKTVQDLLFDAAMVLEYLSKNDTNSAGSGKPNPNHQAILKFLAKKSLIDANTVLSFSTIPLSAAEKVIQSISKNYKKFTTEAGAFAAMNELMFVMVKNMYMVDYQNITTSSTASEISLATQQFLSSISNEASSLQNPSAGYVG